MAIAGGVCANYQRLDVSVFVELPKYDGVDFGSVEFDWQWPNRLDVCRQRGYKCEPQIRRSLWW